MFAVQRPAALILTALAAVLAPARLCAQQPAEVPQPDPLEAIEFFEARIRPLLIERCHACHSAQADSPQAGLSLDSRAGILEGGDRGAALDLANPDASLLLKAIRYADDALQMPPSDAGGRLTDQQIADFEAWVRLGAPYPPSDAPAPGNSAQDRARNHWAFQPVGNPQPPAVHTDRVGNEIDNFILAQLEHHGLTLAPSADRRTLLRRAKYALLGLPPTWEEVQAFENDPSPDAYARLIDGYLASPHYGERWGRYWLDVARYADTKGYVYAREERRFAHAHVYRDWVVNAFNQDMPYDRFLLLQIAADQVAAEDPSSLAAMGFLTVGRRFINVIHDIIDDRIDVLCRGTMGLTVSCARCHDHKYDPIPTEDYYSLYGVFRGSTENIVAIEPPPSTPAGSAFALELSQRQAALAQSFDAKREELHDRLRGMAAQYLAAVPGVARLPTIEFYITMGADEINPVIVRQWHAYLEAAGPNHPIFAPWSAYAALPADQFSALAPGVMDRIAQSGMVINPLVAAQFSGQPPASMADVAQRYGSLLNDAYQAWQQALKTAADSSAEPPAALPDPAIESLRQVLYASDSPVNLPAVSPAEAEFFFAEAAREELGQAQARIDQWLVEAPAAPRFALALEDRSVQTDPRVLVRGNPKNLGATVPRRFLSVLSPPDRQPFEQGSGRLELARAIASPDNPLTARVMVNRVWLHHFGEGLVRTPSDFGTRSEPPSHPDLLDYLARRFMERGWSIKDLHRLIMLSSTYQQASTDNPEARRIDPANRLLWRMNRLRLDFEATRDSLLAVSGQLDPSIGGRAADLTSLPHPRRRTLYGYIDRLNLPTIFRVFDFPSPDAHTAQRHETMVPQQALFLMNNPFVLQQAQHLAGHPQVSLAPTPEEKIQALYQRVFARSPTAEEIALAAPLVAPHSSPESTPPAAPPSPWTYGHAHCDPATGQVQPFAPLPFFTAGAWHAGPQLPELKCGWATLTPQGGNTGRELNKSVVRRWTAPCAGTLEIEGGIGHANDKGDGIRARIVHSRLGELASWTLHKLDATAAVKGLRIEAQDTIDFIVDGRTDITADEFSWAPVLKLVPDGEKPEPETFDAAADFSGPSTPRLGPIERYAHVLLQSNEFVIID